MRVHSRVAHLLDPASQPDPWDPTTNTFFDQAEDGIRDYKVTGVQTCALPISGVAAMLSAVTKVDPCELALHGVFSYVNLYDRPGVKNAVKRPAVDAMIGLALATDSATSVRSEERRVGKEGDSGRFTAYLVVIE